MTNPTFTDALKERFLSAKNTQFALHDFIVIRHPDITDDIFLCNVGKDYTITENGVEQEYTDAVFNINFLNLTSRSYSNRNRLSIANTDLKYHNTFLTFIKSASIGLIEHKLVLVDLVDKSYTLGSVQNVVYRANSVKLSPQIIQIELSLFSSLSFIELGANIYERAEFPGISNE